MDAAAAGSSVEADHSECQERIQELEAKIERLEEQLLEGDTGAVSTVTVSGRLIYT